MTHRTAPLWLMGLTNTVYGMYAGTIAISVPQLLSARHVPGSRIASMVAVMITPGFWAFLFSPILDVRFNRRTYAVFTGLVPAVLLAFALLNLDNLPLAEALFLIGYFFMTLYQSALGGWLSSITSAENENKLSVWMTVGNIAGCGFVAAIAGDIVRNMSPIAGAVLLAVMMALPIATFPWIPAPGPDRRLARESFSQFFGEVVSLLKRREVVLAMLLFLAPVATFSLTNFLSALGDDFHASGHFVGLMGGIGITFGGISGCFLFPLIGRLLSLRFLYLAIGVLGSVFTLALIPFSHTQLTFALATIGENAFQGLAVTAATAIIFETIGRNNPLAATTYCVMMSALAIPITYMLLVDGWGYETHGVVGSYAADAGLSLCCCAIAGALLLLRSARTKAGARELAEI